MADNDNNNWAIVTDLLIQEVQEVRKSVNNIGEKLDQKIDRMDDKIDRRIKWKHFMWIIGFVILGIFAVAGTASYNNVNIEKTTVTLEKHIKYSDKKLDEIKDNIKQNDRNIDNLRIDLERHDNGVNGGEKNAEANNR